MAFFRQFPRTFYNIDNTLINIPDIFRRVVPTDLFDNMSYMLEYDIQDGQKPEHISYDMYDTVDYYWLILVCNNIIDPYYEWPMDGQTFNAYLVNKYQDQSGRIGEDVIDWTKDTTIDENIIYYVKTV